MKRSYSKVMLVLLAASVAFALTEAGLRIAGLSWPNFYMNDPVCGATLRPGAAGNYRDEGESYVLINSRGLRDREHLTVAPEANLRIAVLGDSYAEAMQLPLEQSFWSLLESDLAHCEALLSQEVEVINFGVSGYGTAQELLTLRHKVWEYDPDIVLLAALTGNDIRNNSRELEGDPNKPYFIYRDGQLVLDGSFRNEPAFTRRASRLGRVYAKLREHLRVVQLLRRAITVLGQDSEQAANGPANWEPGLDDTVYLAPPSPAWEEAWSVTEDLIVRMSEEVEERGAAFLVVVLTNSIQVHPDSAVRDEFKKRLGVENLFYPETRLAALAAREGIDLLALAPPLRVQAERSGLYLHGFADQAGLGHWNSDGHRLAARLIADHLCSGSPIP